MLNWAVVRNEVMSLSRSYGGKPWVLAKHVDGVARHGDVVECVSVERRGKERRLQCIIKVGADHHLVDAPPSELLSEPSLELWGPALSSKWWSIDGHHVYIHEFEEWRDGKTWALIAEGTATLKIPEADFETFVTTGKVVATGDTNVAHGIQFRCYVDDIDYLELRACPAPARGPLTVAEASQLLEDGWQRIQIE